ncbi:hypothetical protein IPH19_04075 [Candidatus Uhrbacteria bacterium]|nr:MAG: hypothetical protein IPH19_04075 [Candidatus Uhrbacteria bacterium]
MVSFSWEYVFKPREAQWWVSVIFILVGIGLGLVLPAFLAPSWKGVELMATVSRIETNEEGLVRPVFQVDGQARDYSTSLWSSRSTYAEGESVTIVTDSNTQDWYIKADQDMKVAIWILRLIAIIFFLIGVTVLLLTVFCFPDYLVHTIGGSIGALSFGLPATFALPGLLFAHRTRPNVFFGANDPLGSDTWLIGGIFTALGVLTTIATIILARYQLKNRSLGWSWSYDSDDKKTEQEKIGL